MEPDYSKYNRNELLEAMDSINKDLYPERYEKIIHELSNKPQEAIDNKQPKKRSPLNTHAVSLAVYSIFLSVIFIFEEFPISKTGDAIPRETNPVLFWVLTGFVFVLCIHNVMKLLAKWRRT